MAAHNMSKTSTDRSKVNQIYDWVPGKEKKNAGFPADGLPWPWVGGWEKKLWMSAANRQEWRVCFVNAGVQCVHNAMPRIIPQAQYVTAQATYYSLIFYHI